MAEPATLDAASLRQRWPVPSPDGSSDKEDRGRIVVVGGAAHTPGAVLLAGIAGLRVGAGRLTIATNDSTAVAVAVAVPEAGVIGLPSTNEGALAADAASRVSHELAAADAVLIGPGMANPDTTKRLVADLLRRVGDETVVVLDALASSCGIVDDGLGPVAARTVITPNRTEADHLLDDADGADADVAIRMATRFGVTVVLGSCIAATDGSCWLVPKGNPGLGTSGSGDVLAGAVAGVAARTGSPMHAATWGLTLHGAAGDRVAARVGEVGFLARELLDELPRCLQQLSGY